MAKENVSMDRGAICFAVSGLILVLAGLSTPKWIDYPGQEANPQAGLERQSLLEAGLWTALFEIPETNGKYIPFRLKFSTGKDVMNDDSYINSYIKAEYEWFYGTWMSSVRSLAILTVVWGAGSIALHFWKTLKTHDYFWSNIVFLNYIFTSILGTCAAGTWVGSIAAEKNVVQYEVESYLWRGDYGIGLWLFWIGAGCFLPASALAFEGGFINHKSAEYKKLKEEFENQKN